MTKLSTLYSASLLVAFCMMNVAVSSSIISHRRSVHTYSLDIQESGTRFTEHLTIDTEKKLEIVEVPSHNDVTGATFINDFNLNVSLRREAHDGPCFLTDLSRYIESGLHINPDDIISAMELSKSKSGDAVTIAFKWMIGARVTAGERAILGKEMQQLCDGQTIYKLDRMEDHVTVHEEGLARGPQREKRRAWNVRMECPTEKIGYRCKVSLKNCAYLQLINCPSEKVKKGRQSSHCVNQNTIHLYDQVHCCKACCTDSTYKSLFFPYCNTMTNSQVEAGTCF